MRYDFGGYATKSGLKCSDGRVIMKGAFNDDDHKRVPLVWQHLHDDPDNVLGHADLEVRDDGVYAHCKFNDTVKGLQAKAIVKHGDIDSLSIFANRLRQQGDNVIHGVIREVSLVMAGANPGAKIDNVSFEHSDGTVTLSDQEAIITCGDLIEDDSGELSHADGEETVGEIWESIKNTLNEKQMNVLTAIIGAAASGSDSDDDEVEHSDNGEDDETVKFNVFDKTDGRSNKKALESFNSLAHDAMENKASSLKDYVLSHGVEEDMPYGIAGEDYGVANLDVLFPDYKAIRDTPDVIKRDDEWVSSVTGVASKSPFSRIKMMWFDTTADVARARGYQKGHLKREEVVKLAKRTVGPTTVYKKQRLDRDDIIDVNFDIVNWLKAEMQTMLREEVARAVLIGDGRPEVLADGRANEDKIDESCIIPVYKENELYAYHVQVDMTEPDENARYRKFVDQVALAMIDYKGSGSPTLFTTKKHHIKMKKVRDQMDRPMFSSEGDLTSALGVGRIVEVPVLENVTNEDGQELIGIVVNMKDYTIGMDRGGQTAFFDGFDIDFNQYKYLYETRMSGCLTRMDSALIIEAAKKPPLLLKIRAATDDDSLNLGSAKASELQSGVMVTATGNVDGRLYYKKGFTDFSKNEAYQNGNYLALVAKNEGTDSSAEIYIRNINSVIPESNKFKKLDESGVAVGFITDEMKERLEFKIVSSDGTTTDVQRLDMSGLILTKPDEAKREVPKNSAYYGREGKAE